MNWTPVARCEELAPGKPLRVTHAGENVALFNIDGQYYACSDACPHAGGPLHLGFVRGTVVSCPWHGWAFDLAAGPETTRDGVLRYPVREEAGQLLLGPALSSGQ